MTIDPPPESANFWLDRTRAYSMAMLQDRVEQVQPFIESCRTALDLVHHALFPLNDQPQGLWALLARFRRGFEIKDFVQ
jgi:hypothetical protein